MVIIFCLVISCVTLTFYTRKTIAKGNGSIMACNELSYLLSLRELFISLKNFVSHPPADERCTTSVLWQIFTAYLISIRFFLCTNKIPSPDTMARFGSPSNYSGLLVPKTIKTAYLCLILVVCSLINGWRWEFHCNIFCWSSLQYLCA